MAFAGLAEYDHNENLESKTYELSEYRFEVHALTARQAAEMFVALRETMLVKITEFTP